MWRFRIVRRKRRKRRAGGSRYYKEHKEAARIFVRERLEAMNQHYGFSYNRIAIRDQKSRWGSCSKKGNLNFNYRLLFLPPHLADYVIAHELAHLAEFNHGPKFWELVERADPLYKQHRRELRRTNIVRGKAVTIS